MAEYILGCDIGGTFTDFVVFDAETGETLADKCLTTPADPSQGVMTGVRRLKERLPTVERDTSVVAHASTLTTNAVIERKGARTALLCTRGFPNLLAARRHQRVSTYELFSDPPEPLVPQYDVFEVTERTYSDGRVLTELDEAEVREIAGVLRARGVESVAIAFLHSYANPLNEQEVERILLEEWPDAAVSRSSRVLPEMREYERTSTTVINAYVKPLIERYLTRLRDRLAGEGIEAPLYIMLSNGGLASVDTASDFPVRMTESGPVAGAIIGRTYAEVAELDEVLTFDMGGTTAKACLIRNGELPLASEQEVARSERFVAGSGFPIAMPAVDLIEIGAGGGSIARVNSLGIVQVGPSSAGADPGPICYGLGGDEPTVTDADLLLGYLNPDYFLGGEMVLDSDAAAIGLEALAAELGRDLVETAWTVHEVVNENMAAAVRMHILEKGGDPSRAAAVALGGAGPVHVYNMARRVGMSRVLVPVRAGVLAALGLLVTPPAFDAVRTHRVPFEKLDLDAVHGTFVEMETEVAELLRTVDSDRPISFVRRADCKYIGQGYAVPVTLGDGASGLSLDALREGFAAVYREKYGYFYDDVAPEIVNLRVSGVVAGRTVQLQPTSIERDRSGDSVKGARPAYSGQLRKMVDHTVYDRYLLGPGSRLDGPAIIEEKESTTVVDVGGSVEVDKYGSLIIDIAQ